MKDTGTEQPKSNEKAGDGEQPSRAFSRECRLLKAHEFSHVFAGAYRSADRFFTVLGRVSELPTPRARLGLAIAKKQLRRAVDRNRIKRLVREYFRTQVLAAPSGRALDYVVMARSAVRDTDGATLRESLARHFRRIQQQVASGNDTDPPVP